MQDRFKFRVWDKENKCMYYPTRYSNFTIVNGTVVKIESYPIANSAYLGKRIAWEFDDAVIMQCTGLKDKNGKLIYEGDIIVNEKFVKYITKWNDNIGQFYISKINPSKYDNWKDWHLARHDLDYEVIGNIYKNKELLNEI